MVSTTNIFKLKEGAKFDAEEFESVVSQLGGKEEGILRQYWGEQVENPGLITWVVDYDSVAKAKEVVNSETFRHVKKQLHEFVAEIDLNNLKLTTEWTSPTTEVTAAMQAAITEVAFFTLSTASLTVDEAIKAVEAEMETIEIAVKNFRNTRGGATGWIHDQNSDQVLLHGVFGYDSLEDHMEWRKHPAHGKAVDAFKRLAERGVTLTPTVDVRGVDAEKGYFHVEFEHD